MTAVNSASTDGTEGAAAEQAHEWEVVDASGAAAGNDGDAVDDFLSLRDSDILPPGMSTNLNCFLF